MNLVYAQGESERCRCNANGGKHICSLIIVHLGSLVSIQVAVV